MSDLVPAHPQQVIGRLIPPAESSSALVRVVTVVVTDYAGHSREEAAAQVWADWSARLPGVAVRVVHAGDGWEPVW